MHRLVRPSARSVPGHRLRHRGLMMTPSVAEAVRFAGGWLFDRVLEGAEVMVLTPDHDDCRPLRILGARVIDLECALSCPVQGPWPPESIVVGADLYDADARVRRILHRALEDGPVDVRLWGDREPGRFGGAAGSVAHRMSLAARAFKSHALAAAAVSCDAGEATEMFWSGAALREVP